jgi:hypothetical protein
MTGLRAGKPRNRASISSREKKHLSCPKCPDLLLVFNGLFPRVKTVGAQSWPSPNLPILRMIWTIFPSSLMPSWLGHGQFYLYLYLVFGGTQWRSWLRHCATYRNVAGSVRDFVTGIFHSYIPSGLTVALGLAQPLTNMCTRYISWGVKAAGAYGW